MSEKLTRADAKLKNMPKGTLQDLWRFRHPEEGGEAMTLEAVAVEVKRLYAISISLSSLSEFYRWLDVKRRIDAKSDLADQFKQELASNPENSEESIRKAGQVLFLAEGVMERDFRKFTSAAKMTTEAVKLKQADQKIALQREVVNLDKTKFALLERKARAMDEAAEQMKLLKAGGTLMPDAERTAILDKMDEILGLKK